MSAVSCSRTWTGWGRRLSAVARSAINLSKPTLSGTVCRSRYYLSKPLIQPINDRHRLRIAHRDMLRPNADEIAVPPMQPDRRVMGIALPDIVQLPQTRVLGEGRAGDVREAGLEAVGEEAEQYA